MKLLIVRTQIQRNLFDIEFSGQISDGKWENSGPRDHWKDWDCEVVVGENVGRNFSAMKDNYNLNSKDLYDAIGDRMLEICKMTIAGFTPAEIQIAEGYDLEFLEKHAVEGNKYYIEKLAQFKAIDSSKFEALKNIQYTMKEMNEEIKELKKAIKVRN